MNRRLTASRVGSVAVSLLFGAALTALAACGGGGSTGGLLPGGGATPTPTPTPSSATAQGTVVDYTSNTPLSAVPIAIASWAPGASPSPVATTGPNGSFSFTTSAGTYLLVVGSNSPTDTRATLHEKIVLNSGSNTVIAATPAPEPDVTPLPSQTSGAVRLMALNAVQQACITGANQGRTSMSLPQLVADEYLEEDATATLAEEDSQQTDTPNPLFSFGQEFGTVGGLTTVGSAGGPATSPTLDCTQWAGQYSYGSGTPPYQFATNAANIWYGAVEDSNGNFGVQMWNPDPR